MESVQEQQENGKASDTIVSVAEDITAAVELSGDIAMFQPLPIRRCACGARRDRGRQLCDACRLERLRERDARRRTKAAASAAPIPGQLTLFEVL